MNTQLNIALLFDGDNAQAATLESVIQETSKHGRITIKRIYGDWSSPTMASWKEKLKIHSIKPIQKFANIKGKNATDIALVIDAMDILHKEQIDGFCIVSSDSDFTELASRIKESAKMVIGIGQAHTPKSFIKACDIFTFTENFIENDEGKTASKQHPNDKIDHKLINKAYAMVESDNGAALMRMVCQSIRKLDPSFDPRTYGFKIMSPCLPLLITTSK